MSYRICQQKRSENVSENASKMIAKTHAKTRVKTHAKTLAARSQGNIPNVAVACDYINDTSLK
jgi:hypothetical protein